MMGINKIKAIGFDWDGTLVNSMSIKAQGFAESTIRFYPSLKNKRKEIESMYIATRGNPRTYQLSLIQQKYQLKKLSDEKEKRWSNLFTSSYLNKKLPLFGDALMVLDELKNREYRLFLCSSVPQEDLDKTLKLYPLENYFEFTLGMREKGKFKKGVVHLTYISKKMGISLNEIAFVGDGAEDVKGANEAGCFSIGKTDPKIPNSKEEIGRSKPKLIIKNLKELLDYF